ncbi:hypothetical protein [Saccharopolyspora sp. NPDC002376]
MSIDRSSMIGPFPLPAIDSLRERARALAGTGRQWLAIEDPAVPTGGPLPKAAIQGGYEVTADGELTGRYQINPSYRPSVQVAGMPLTTTDLALWRALHGYSPLGMMVDTLYRSELALYAEHEGDHQLAVTRTSDGQAVLTAFTATQHIPAEWAHHQRVPAWTILDTMHGQPVFLSLNPGTPLALKMLIHDLATLTTDRTRQRRDLGAIPLDTVPAAPQNDQAAE